MNRTLLKRYILCVLGLVFLLINSCQKDVVTAPGEQVVTVTKGSPLKIKDWVENLYHGEIITNGFGIYSPNKVRSESAQLTFSIDWNNATTFIKGDSTVVEVALSDEELAAFSLASSAFAPNEYQDSYTKTLVIKEGGSSKIVLMTVIGDKGTKAQLQNVHLLDKPSTFNGLVIYHTTKGSFLNGFKYVNGKPVKTVSLHGRPANTSSVKAGKSSKVSSEFICTDIVIQVRVSIPCPSDCPDNQHVAGVQHFHGYEMLEFPAQICDWQYTDTDMGGGTTGPTGPSGTPTGGGGSGNDGPIDCDPTLPPKPSEPPSVESEHVSVVPPLPPCPETNGTGGNGPTPTAIPYSQYVKDYSVHVIKGIIDETANNFELDFGLTEAEKAATALVIFNHYQGAVFSSFADIQNFYNHTTEDDPGIIALFRSIFRKVVGLDAPKDAEDAEQVNQLRANLVQFGNKIENLHNTQLAIFGFVSGYAAFDNYVTGHHGAAAVNASLDLFGGSVLKSLYRTGKSVIYVANLTEKFPTIASVSFPAFWANQK